jgi:hypothetical protein
MYPILYPGPRIVDRLKCRRITALGRERNPGFGTMIFLGTVGMMTASMDDDGFRKEEW